jgi:hypothetical protein
MTSRRIYDVILRLSFNSSEWFFVRRQFISVISHNKPNIHVFGLLMSFKHLKSKINLCSNRRYPTDAIKVTRFQTCAINNKNEITAFFFKLVSQFSLQERKLSETVAEEYCWAITEVGRRSCCGQSGSSMLEFGFQLDCHVCS